MIVALALTVYAASSLREAFTEIAKAYERSHPGVHVALDLAGSQELRVQIENGAAADVFASADDRQVRKLAVRGTVFAHNQPVLVVPPDNPAHIERFEDLAKARRVVLGASEVPIGAYSDQILRAAGIAPRVVSRELNVRQVLAKVSLGEADAGIVYSTDAIGGGVKVIQIPQRWNVRADYVIAAISDAGRGFVELVLSPQGQAALRRRGFLP